MATRLWYLSNTQWFVRRCIDGIPELIKGSAQVIMGRRARIADPMGKYCTWPWKCSTSFLQSSSWLMLQVNVGWYFRTC